MTGFNLPPGCNESDIPGNRPEDIEWEALIEDIMAEGLTCVEARRRWNSQPDLLEAAKEAWENMENAAEHDCKGWDCAYCGKAEIREMLRAAIEKATNGR